MKGIIHRDIDVVSPDTRLSDCLVPSAQSVLPLAVVEDEKLVGVVPRATLLEAIGRPGVAPAGPEEDGNRAARQEGSEVTARDA